MTDYQRNLLKRLQVAIGCVKHESQEDTIFRQKLQELGLPTDKMWNSGLTIANILQSDEQAFYKTPRI